MKTRVSLKYFVNDCSLKKFLIQTHYSVFFRYTLKSELKKNKEPKVAMLYFPLASVIITAQ